MSFLQMGAVTMRLLIAVIAGTLVISGCQGVSETYSFALIGCGPYDLEDRPRYDAMISEINADPDVELVIHAGDIKGGKQSCSDEFLRDRLAILNRFEDPLILTPGDNEWTDCHSDAAGRFDPLERLGVLRTLFYSDPGMSLGGRPMRVESQASSEAWSIYRENVRWSRNDVHFATIHIVGSRNGTAPFEGRTAASDAEVEDRTRGGIAWLRYAFDRARSENARALFITIHGNPGIDRPERAEPYRPFMAALREETAGFGHPVVLAHADSHYFRIDKPLRQPPNEEATAEFHEG